MNHHNAYLRNLCGITLCCLLSFQVTRAQTDVDAIMLNKNVLCVGAMYSHSSWKNYWEGDFKRNNLNLGTVSSRMYGVMGTYGITNKLNFIFSLPYVQTHATSGTLKGFKGLQDFSAVLKWMPYLQHIGDKGIISAYAIGGFSTPASNYVADYLPLSIGMHSTNLSLRGMVDYQRGNFFATASGVFMYRSNVKIDRDAYYTTEMHYTNKVAMPDVAGYNIRAGYRSNVWIAEAVLENMTTLGGYDIRKNDMPFLSNKMNATMAGVNFKYSFTIIQGLELTGGIKHTISGRNVGQSTIYNGGVFYIMNFSRKSKVNTNSKTS